MRHHTVNVNIGVWKNKVLLLIPIPYFHENLLPYQHISSPFLHPQSTSRDIASIKYWNSHEVLPITLYLARQHNKQIHLLSIPNATSVSRKCRMPFRIYSHCCWSHCGKCKIQYQNHLSLQETKMICPVDCGGNQNKNASFYLALLVKFSFINPHCFFWGINLPPQKLNLREVQSPKAMLYNRAATSHVWPLSTQDVANPTEMCCKYKMHNKFQVFITGVIM